MNTKQLQTSSENSSLPMLAIPLEIVKDCPSIKLVDVNPFDENSQRLYLTKKYEESSAHSIDI